jgi:hypothetical protein
MNLNVTPYLGHVDRSADAIRFVREPWNMWRRLNNWWTSLWTYFELRPDIGARYRINQALRDRPSHLWPEWYRRFWEPQGVAREVAEFVYRSVARHSGLKVEKVVPSDRLNEDLKLPLICWFDWEMSFYEDFSRQLGVDMDADDWLMSDFYTVADLMVFLNQQFRKSGRLSV